MLLNTINNLTSEQLQTWLINGDTSPTFTEPDDKKIIINKIKGLIDDSGDVNATAAQNLLDNTILTITNNNDILTFPFIGVNDDDYNFATKTHYPLYKYVKKKRYHSLY